MSNKILSELEYRKVILQNARKWGCEKEVMIIFAETDKQIRLCGNESERKDIAKLAITKLYTQFNAVGGLAINGAQIFPPEKQ